MGRGPQIGQHAGCRMPRVTSQGRRAGFLLAPNLAPIYAHLLTCCGVAAEKRVQHLVLYARRCCARPVRPRTGLASLHMFRYRLCLVRAAPMQGGRSGSL
jgi:hypothetical protein